MKKTIISVAVGFGLVWVVIVVIVQRDIAKIRESEKRANAIHEKTMAEDEERWKAKLDRLGVKPKQ